MFRKSLTLLLLLAFTAPLAAQVTEKKDPNEEAENLRKEAVAFLRETMGDVGSLRTLENRISFTAEMAGLMWYHDEREARAMFGTAVSDFRELLSRLEQQMNQFPEDTEGQAYQGGLIGDVSGRARVEMKYRIAMAVRQQMTSSIAEHDPDVALGFFYDTATADERLEKSYGYRDTYFESTLLGQVAEKNAAKAAQFGIRSIDKGVRTQHLELLRKIYEKDVDKGIEFGGAILSKIKSDADNSKEIYMLGTLLDTGDQILMSSRASGKRPLYTQAELRDVAGMMASRILDTGEAESSLHWLPSIEKFHPARAAQIRAKTGGSPVSANSYSKRANGSYQGVMNTSATGVANYNVSNSNSANSKWLEEQEAKAAAEKKLMEDVESIGKGKLPKEERDRVVGQARKIMMQSQGRDKQIMGLSMLAAQVSRAGDKELADEIMRDAERLVNPQPKNYQDFMFTWMLAGGYAEANPDKAFPILEDAIGRANNVISAFVQAAEFIDVTEEMISDGEAQVGAFGGGMIRGLGKELGIAEATIDLLAKVDFAKTKALTNRFERPEVRVLAKMLVLRSVLGKKAPEPSLDQKLEAATESN